MVAAGPGFQRALATRPAPAWRSSGPHLDKESAAVKPTLTLVGVKAMLEEEQTPAFKAFAPRRLSGGEMAVIRAWYEKAQQQE